MPFTIRESRIGGGAATKSIVWVPAGAQNSIEDISAALSGRSQPAKKFPVVVYLSTDENELLPVLKNPGAEASRVPPPPSPGLLDVLRLFEPTPTVNPFLVQQPTSEQMHKLQMHFAAARKCADLVGSSCIVVVPLLGTLAADSYPPQSSVEKEKTLVATLDVLLRDIAAEYSVNGDKTYLIGSGRGSTGNGFDAARLAWKFAVSRPWTFAAVAFWELPLWDVDEASDGGQGARPMAKHGEQLKTAQKSSSLLERECLELRRMPVWIFSSPKTAPEPLAVAQPPKRKLRVKITKSTSPPSKHKKATPKPATAPQQQPHFQNEEHPDSLFDTLSGFLAAKQPAPSETPSLGSDLVFQSLRATGNPKILRTILSTAPTDGQKAGQQITRTESSSPFAVFDFWRWLLGHSRPRGASRM